MRVCSDDIVDASMSLWTGQDIAGGASETGHRTKLWARLPSTAHETTCSATQRCLVQGGIYCGFGCFCKSRSEISANTQPVAHRTCGATQRSPAWIQIFERFCNVCLKRTILIPLNMPLATTMEQPIHRTCPRFSTRDLGRRGDRVGSKHCLEPVEGHDVDALPVAARAE